MPCSNGEILPLIFVPVNSSCHAQNTLICNVEVGDDFRDGDGNPNRGDIPCHGSTAPLLPTERSRVCRKLEDDVDRHGYALTRHQLVPASNPFLPQALATITLLAILPPPYYYFN
ncbi:hypothetical protein U9M48_004631 [Paspalum notatum var. saurae]|uniref:Uncharacterized protein n=1 Tax=Paspalum notatum var. saurae TaxID=547442 RepID=A0AAQ3PP34_PASNO